ncbi:MAG: hypothetical protein ACOYIF_01150 [Acetivibrionales bacterium]|jgi:hypothetical protein
MSGNYMNNCERESNDSNKKIRVINIGIQVFYEALKYQNVKAVQIDWRPPVKQSEEITSILDMLL